ncbi:MAG: DUF1552 domain-containing protein [Verrucomicrobiota bacterium]
MNRRHALRALGATISLPVFEQFGASVHAANRAKGLATTASGAPLRMAYLYVPNGVNVDLWECSSKGGKLKLGKTLEPLGDLKHDISVLKNLEHKLGVGGADGGGDHARANATFLTGARPRKTAGANIQLGISADQVVANEIGHLTRLSSLELSCAPVRSSGSCDSGYSCAYQYNLSWRSETTPMTPETDPRLVFERLFGQGTGAERKKNLERRRAQQDSILDYILSDAKSLHSQLGRTDQAKLDEYLTGVREVEKQIEKAERFPLPDPGVAAPEGIPESREEYLRLMADILVLAFRTDSTRVASLLMAHDGDNGSHRQIGISEGHHTLSHHKDNPETLKKIAQIDYWYAQQLRYFLDKLRNTQDSDGQSLLHNSMIVYGSGLSDGNKHRHNNLPLLVAGQAGGALKTDRMVKQTGDTPMANLYLSQFDLMGVPNQERFGDSTGRLNGLV